MKIYFCDMCNESIPLTDIKDNQAVTIKGKIYCRNCNPLKEMEQKITGTPSSPFASVLTILVAVLLVAVSAVIGYLIWERSGQEIQYATADALQEANGLVQHLQNELGGIGEELVKLQNKIDGQGTNLSKMDSELVVIRGDVSGLKSEFESMTPNFETVTNVRKRLDALDVLQGGFSTTLTDLKSRIGDYGARLADLESRIESLAAGGGIPRVGVVGDEEETPGSTKESPELQAIKKKLASKDDGERFEAVFEVLDNRIKEALPYVVPLIEDPDPFVQIGAMQSVGEFLYMEALPSLVKVLRDPDVTVRDEALRQLIRMTGQNNLNFNVRGSESEREKAVRKWEKWLKESGSG